MNSFKINVIYFSFKIKRHYKFQCNYNIIKYNKIMILKMYMCKIISL